jgi:hypothetical protein
MLEGASMSFGRRKWLAIAGATVFFGSPLVAVAWTAMRTPRDTTPEGAYLRIALALSDGKLENAFAYLENEAQWACFTILKYRKLALQMVRSNYPEPERSRLIAAFQPLGDAPDGPDVFAREAKRQGWDHRLARDMSGVKAVEIQGERATVQTIKGTRYPFRQRPNGIWGLTLFTAHLQALAERSARDYSLVQKAAADYRAAAVPSAAPVENQP